MTHRVKLLTAVMLCLFTQSISATDELVPDIDLLEFLGTIAGLESMGIEIDQLLAGSGMEYEAETEEVTEMNKGDSDD
ncbi:MAG: hypothetical protein ACPGSM_15465 [Thiolinea sp.]